MSNKMNKETKEDEKELLFFIEDEYDRDEDAEVVDPCHQNLMRLLDKLLLITAMFITVVIGTSITVAIIYTRTGPYHHHSIDTTLKSSSVSLPNDQSYYSINDAITMQSENSYLKWSDIILCSNLQRKSVLKNLENKSKKSWCSSDDSKYMLKKFIEVLYRNTSDIVSPLDENNLCDILHASQPKVKSISTENDIIKSLYENTCDNSNDFQKIIRLLASQYDEEDAIVSIGDPTKHFVSNVKNCSSDTSNSSQAWFISVIKRMSPLTLESPQKICNSLKMFSIEKNGFPSPKVHEEGDLYHEQKINYFNTRIILDAEIYDQTTQSNLSSDENLKDVYYTFQLKGRKNNVNDSYLLQSIRIYPGYQTNVVINSCLQKRVDLTESSVSNSKPNTTFQVLQNIEMTPWKMSLTESMIAFGRVGYRLQFICTAESNSHRKVSLEENYPNICKEIENIEFKANGESNIAQAVFKSEDQFVTNGANDILSYIKDNIAILYMKLDFNTQKSC